MTKKLLLLTLFLLIFVVLFSSILLFGVFESRPPVKKEVVDRKVSLEIVNFKDALSKLETPQQLIDYLNYNFYIVAREDIIPYSPDVFLQSKTGSHGDFANFIAKFLDQKGYETALVRFKTLKEGRSDFHTVVVFRDKDGPKYIIPIPSGLRIISYGWSFEELFVSVESIMGAQITDYLILPSHATDFNEKPDFKWVSRKKF